MQINLERDALIEAGAPQLALDLAFCITNPESNNSYKIQ